MTHTHPEYDQARSRYAEWGVRTDAAIRAALRVPISIHCWQADDVSGLENKTGPLSGGGILTTGGYPGAARNGNEIRADLETAISLIPGRQRINIHACYAEPDHAMDRDTLEVSAFHTWIAWARKRKLQLDFNPTFFAHPMAEDGFTLSHPDPTIRAFWIRHARACRRIAEAMAQAQGGPCLVNWWTPDGSKECPIDTWGPRSRLAESYDAIFRRSPVDRTACVDYLESKLFGIGSESYVVDSAEFCADYALSRGIGLTLDMGHFHPTETIDGKISGHLTFLKNLLLHVSRPVRWDSDHVVLFNDDLKNVFLEIQRGRAWPRVAVALDYFDASINRIAAYIIGARATRKAILYALLDPTARLLSHERAGHNAHRLALAEEMKTLPFDAVWNRLCEVARVPVGDAWLASVETYERDVLSARGRPRS